MLKDGGHNTGDEKWIHYDNLKRKKSWNKSGHALTSTAKPNIQVYCIWWDQQNIMYYELLQRNETIIENRYRLQLMHLSRALKEKRPQYEQRHKVILKHYNARPLIAQAVKIYLEMLKSYPIRRTLLILSRLLFVPIDDTRSFRAELLFVWRYQKMDRLVDSFKRCRLFSTRN